MKISEYIAGFLVKQGVSDIFGYQGTMIAYLVDAICKQKKIKNHTCYHEQGAAFAAVGYAKATGKVGVAYATSGPGAMNLMSGIADAYFDSTPTVFFTGQLNLNEYTDIPTLRQQGFQQMNVISAVKSYTKFCKQIRKKEDIRYILEKAFFLAQDGRKGPVVIDIPMNIQKEIIEPDTLKGFCPAQSVLKEEDYHKAAFLILEKIRLAKRPLVLLGNGIQKNSHGHITIMKFIHKLNIPFITSLPAYHLVSYGDECEFGYLGAAYGSREANLLANQKADLIVSFGCSMCRRQTGGNPEKFAKNAEIIRVDLDEEEIKRKVHKEELSLCLDYEKLVYRLLDNIDFHISDNWFYVCKKSRQIMRDFDKQATYGEGNLYMQTISELHENAGNVFSDVGQHQIWAAQSYKTRKHQRLLFSGGHGAMGFALPAAIGGYYSSGKQSIVLCGDGAIQMNIQEFQWLYREQLPIFVYIFNNHSLGLIRQQQNDFFDGNHFGSAEEEYTTPSFVSIAHAYGIDADEIHTIEDLKKAVSSADQKKPHVFEIFINADSVAYPKTYFGEEMHNQRPYLPSDIQKVLEEL